MDKEKILLTYRDVAELLGIKKQTLRKWVSQRRIEHLKIGKSVRFRPEQIEAFMQQSTVPAGGGR